MVTVKKTQQVQDAVAAVQKKKNSTKSKTNEPKKSKEVKSKKNSKKSGESNTHVPEQLVEMDTLTHDIAIILNKASKSSANFKKYVKQLRKLRKDTTEEKFLNSMISNLKVILPIAKKEPSVERVIDFVAAFCAFIDNSQINTAEDLEDEEMASCELDPELVNFALLLSEKILKFANAKNKTVRYRACQIASSIISNLPDDVDVNEDLCERLVELARVRLDDKFAPTRLAAIKAVARFNSDAQDEINKLLLRLMKSDTDNSVRIHALQNLTLFKANVPLVVERIRDSCDEVRLAAFEKIASVSQYKVLTIKQRVDILKYGLQDRNQKVVEAVQKILFCDWLNQVDYKVIQLLEALDVEHDVEAVSLIVRTILEKCYSIYKKPQMENLIDPQIAKKILESKPNVELLTAEDALLWRIKCEFFKEKEDDDLLDQTLPNATSFCIVIIKYNSEEKEFVTKQLLSIGSMIDYTDEYGRKNMQVLLAQLLVTFSEPDLYVKEIIFGLQQVYSSNEDFLSAALEAIDSLRKAALEQEKTASKESAEDREAKMKSFTKKIKQLTRTLKDLEKQKAEQIEEEDFGAAQKTKEEIQKTQQQVKRLEDELQHMEKETAIDLDIMFWLRSLFILSELFENASTQLDMSNMKHLLKDLVLINIDHENEVVRQISFKVLGQFCCVKADFVAENLSHFVAVLKNSKEDVDIKAVVSKALFDVFMVHDMKQLFETEQEQIEESSKAMESILYLLREGLLSDDSNLKTIAVEGFSKWLYCRRLPQEFQLEILSLLIIQLFDPSTEEQDRLRQCLTVFLPSYSMSSVEHMEQICKIIVPTIRRAKVKNSEEVTTERIDLSSLGSFMLHISDPSEKVKQDSTIQDRLLHEKVAYEFLFEMLATSSSKDNIAMSKLFTQLVIYAQNQVQIKHIHHLIEKVRPSLASLNKTAEKTLAKFGTYLSQLFENKEEELNEEQIELLENAQEKFDMQRGVFVEALLSNDQFNVAQYLFTMEDSKAKEVLFSPKPPASMSKEKRRKSTRMLIQADLQKLLEQDEPIITTEDNVVSSSQEEDAMQDAEEEEEPVIRKKSQPKRRVTIQHQPKHQDLDESILDDNLEALLSDEDEQEIASPPTQKRRPSERIRAIDDEIDELLDDLDCSSEEDEK